jgi:hypothetical protein
MGTAHLGLYGSTHDIAHKSAWGCNRLQRGLWTVSGTATEQSARIVHSRAAHGVYRIERRLENDDISDTSDASGPRKVR